MLPFFHSRFHFAGYYDFTIKGFRLFLVQVLGAALLSTGCVCEQRPAKLNIAALAEEQQRLCWWDEKRSGCSDAGEQDMMMRKKEKTLRLEPGAEPSSTGEGHR